MPGLPNITRDDILRSASEILPTPGVDIGKAVAGAAAAAGARRRERPRRWPRALGGLLLAGVAAWAIWSSEALRARLVSAAGTVRERVSALRSDRNEFLDDEPIAFQGARTAPIEDSPYIDRPADAIDYPAGLGSDASDDAPSLEKTASSAQ